MPEFFLELFSEEIPARMQRDAAHELERVTAPLFAELNSKDTQTFYGPRRIAISTTLEHEKRGGVFEARGPREHAPDAALKGFLGKHSASREDIAIEDGYYWLRRATPPISASDLLTKSLSDALADLSWPKSMRWGQSGNFTWVRPLRRIVCLLDGAVLRFQFGPVTSSDETEGHRFMSPGSFSVSGVADWEARLRERKVYADEDVRRQFIVDGLDEAATDIGLTVVKDYFLTEEVNGLVEWPVPLIGKIDNDFMSLPPEVRELSMKVNQRYFALRDSEGRPAPYFAFVSNIEAEDGGQAIIAGNERVLRARLSDARHFWDLDLKTPLSELLPKLNKITFHAKIGSQGERVKRIANLAAKIAEALGAEGYATKQAEWAGLLSKADLVTGMVSEFPELQGIMGGYYAEINPRGWDGSIVGPAIKSHYQPKGPADEVPAGLVAISVALADKLDTLVEFFKNNEKPKGSGDPYALRRAALGVIRIIVENELRLPLSKFIDGNPELLDFFYERLRVLLRSDGRRHDVVLAVTAVGKDDDLLRIVKKTDAVSDMLATDYGASLLSASRRAINILAIEESNDGIRFLGTVDPRLMHLDEEKELFEAIGFLAGTTIVGSDGTSPGMLELEQFDKMLRGFSMLRAPVDSFFEKVTVNSAEPELRHNRLQLLARLRDLIHQIADFSKIEG